MENLADRFDWSERPESFVLIAQWSSRTAEFARWRARSAYTPDVVIKAPHRVRRLDEVRLPHERLELFQQFAAPLDQDAGIHVARGRGWLAEPALFAMNHIEGVELGKLLTQWDRDTNVELMRRRVWSCGKFLARVHSLTAVDGGHRDIGAVQDACAVHNRIACGLLRPDLRAERVGTELVLGERYGDFAPYNLRITPEGEMWLFDPPGGSRFAPIQQDIACFLHAVRRDLARRDPSMGGPPTSELSRVLCTAFLHGYAESSTVSICSPGSLSVIRLYDTHRRVGLARKRTRERRYIAAARILASLCRPSGAHEPPRSWS